VRLSSEFKAQELANTAWALAKRWVYNEPLLDSISMSARMMIAQFKM